MSDKPISQKKKVTFLLRVKNVFFRESGKNEVILYDFSKMIFTWPLMFLGFILYPLHGAQGLDSEIMAWVYIFTLATVLLTLGIDLGRNASVAWFIFVLLFCVGGFWLRDRFNLPYITWFHDFFADIDPQYPAGMAYSLSWILLLFFFLALCDAVINHRWRITHNEIEHHSFGRKDDAFGRGAKQIVTKYPDILELLICMAGTIEIRSASGRRRLGEISHVPFLPFRVGKISRLMETKQIVDASLEEEAEDDEADDENEGEELL